LEALMSDYAYETEGEALPLENSGELVHWMEPKPVALSASGFSAAVAGAFVAGVGVTLAVLAMTHWLGPRRDAVPRVSWRKRMRKGSVFDL
jgi:hypothetical protein